MKTQHKTLFTAISLSIVGFIIMFLGNSPTNKNTPDIEQRSTTTHSNHTKKTKTPERIVCITPLGTELLYALGCNNKLIGVDIYSNYPPEAAKIAKVGSFFDTNFETITALKPDMIVILGQSQKITDFCSSNNIRLLRLKMSDTTSIYEDILLTGEIMNCPERASLLCKSIFADLNDIMQKVIVNNGGSIQRQKVFLCMSRKPGAISNLGTVGPDTCLTELISIAGGVNIFDDLPLPYADISKESLISRAPDIIIEATSAQHIATSSDKMLEEWQILDLPATTNHKVYFIDENILHRPGVRSATIAKQLYQFINQQ